MVPYEGFDLLKKRKPRPKVDLDPETNRIWKLLMGKEGNEATEAEDKGKEKWWEEERNVFRGRADSFIARMHLVQGTKRSLLSTQPVTFIFSKKIARFHTLKPISVS